eukprot:TRINITY_DN67272_c0_g1_i1.p1 TRINITY_DN67272_c0_g1~~TRINITY_DN67272_c0_g1_i1.p1  ORF type:complete len:587 (+),score=64.37 TRINITY_DN67272_c0_g1_i1:33-1793(+)
MASFASQRCVFGFMFAALATTGILLKIFASNEAGSVSSDYVVGMAMGMAAGVLHTPGATCPHITGWIRVLLVTLVVAVTVSVVTYPLCCGPELSWARRWGNLAVCFGTALLAVMCILTFRAGSRYVYDAMWCVMSFWLAATLLSAYYIEVARGDLWVSSLLACSLTLQSLAFGWVCELFARFVEALGIDSLIPSTVLVYIMMGVYFSNAVAFMLGDLGPSVYGFDWKILVSVIMGLRIVFLLIWFTYTSLLSASLFVSWRILRLEAGRVHGTPRVEARWARRLVLIHLVSGASVGMAVFITWSLFVVIDVLQLQGESYFGVIRHVFAPLTRFMFSAVLVIGSWGVAIFSGLIGFAPPPLDDTHSLRLLRSNSGLTFELATPARTVYRGKVTELAHRGFALSSLLVFWEMLLERRVMPSFDPHRSTTNDVVRQVIIPASRYTSASGEVSGSALATIWNRGHDSIPKRMVTHNWTNLFLDLVAAIIADSLNVPTFDEIAARIVDGEGFTAVKAELAANGALDLTFWVCAFSINQHASICGGFGPAPPVGSQQRIGWDSKRYDTVTGLEHPACRCSVPKIFNDEPSPAS